MSTGGCLCGSVRYRLAGAPAFAGFCYCRDCQRASGAGRLPVMGFAGEAVTITGTTASFTVPGGSGLGTTRHFCPTCGSLLFGLPGNLPAMITVYAGTLDDPAFFAPQTAVFARDRPAWEHTVPPVVEYLALPA